MAIFENQNNSIIHRTSTDIQNYMTQVYGWMTVGLLLTSFVAWYAINDSNIVMYMATHSIVLIGLILSEFALVMGLSLFLTKLSMALATSMFMLYSALTGLTLSLVLVTYTGAFITSTFFITAAMFSAISLYGYTTKRSLNGIGSFLFMVLIGMIIASSINIWLKNSGLTLILTYIGVLVFSGLTAYDTQKLKSIGSQINFNDPEKIRKYVIIGALTLYLDFINSFLIMLRALSNNNR